MASQLLSQQVSSSIEGNNFIDTGKNSHIDIDTDACIDTNNITTGDRIDTSSPTPPSIPPPPVMTTIETRGDRIADSESVSVSSPKSSSSSSLQQQRQQQQLSPRQLLKSGSSSSSSSNNNKKQLHVQLKPASSPAPFFTSFEVQNKKCTVYVGNIPFNNDKKPCRICCSSCFDNNYDNEAENNNEDNDNEKKEDEKYDDNDDCEHEKKSKEMEDEDEEEEEEGVDEKANNDYDYDYDTQGCCDCEIELKKFLRERIHAAFKVPMKDIGIRTVRFFSVVTNMYDVNIVNNKNNCNDEDKEEEEEDDDDDVYNNTKHHQKYQQQFRLRRHSAACVEFDDPNNAEYALALKNTAFIYDNDNSPSGSSRTTLRMRRWNTNTNTIESLSPSPPEHSSPKQSSPKQSSSQLLLALSTLMPQLPITNNNKSNSTTYNESGGGNNDHDNDNDIDTPFESAVHVGNLPSGEVTADDIRLFFFRRMSKAFHGVPPPKIIRVGVRSRRKSNTNNTTTNEIIENDAYVEFQDSRVAYRATILKNRRWYVELHRDYDDNENNNKQLQSENNDNVDNKSNNSNIESRRSSDMERKYSGKINNKDSDTMATTEARNSKKWWKMPMLEIEAWDSNRYEVDNFFLTDDNNADNKNKNNQEENERDDKECLPENNDDEEVSNSDDDPSSLQQRIGNKGGEEENSDDDNDNNNVMTNKNKHAERKGISRKPTTSSVCTNVVAELRMRGFLICKNEDKIPNLDHLFTTDDGKKEGHLCHGYVFRGKVCRAHNSNKFRRSKSNNNNNGNNGCGCAYAHINSFEDIKDPHDQMAVLYYVNNNDDVEFVHGEGCTPQEFLLRQQQQQEQSKKSEKKGADPVSTNDKMMQDENPQDDKDDQRSIIIRDLEKELEVTCQKLQEEEQLSRNRREEIAVLKNQWRTSQESTEEMLQELRSNLSTVRQELVTTQQELEESKRECALLKNETMQQQQNTTIKNKNNNNKLSPLPNISQLEVSKFKYELQQSQANSEPEESITEHSFGKSWPCAKSKFSSFDNFLHASVPTLMEMSYKETTNGKTKKVEGRFSPDESRLDLLRTPTTAQNQLSLSASTLFSENSASPMVMELHAVDNEMIARLRSEFALVGSFYGSEEVVMDGISTVTRYLKLPIGGDFGDEKERRCINVDLILTIPNGYPVRGVIGVGTRIPDGDSVCEGSHSGAKIELEHYLSSLLSVCQLEAQVCQGKEALLNILATAENWVKNDDPYPKKEERV